MWGDQTTTIFGSPQGKSPNGEKRGKEFGLFVSVFVILPLLALVGLLQLPVLAVAIPWYRWKHRRFVARTKANNRVMPWSDFAQCVEEKRGTLLIEGSEIKWRNWWWTEEDVHTVSPHPLPENKLIHNRKEQRALLPFREWCYARYTEPSNGRALLVLGEVKSQLDLLKNNPDINVVAFQPLSWRLARKARPKAKNGRANPSG